MSKILWNQIEAIYRGQSNSGTVITVDEDAMNKAIKYAGNSVFDTEWWMESLTNVLEHWGLRSKRWMDTVTGMPRLHYRLAVEHQSAPTSGPLNASGGASTGLGTGPLMTRILNSGKLNSGGLDSGKLKEEEK